MFSSFTILKKTPIFRKIKCVAIAYTAFRKKMNFIIAEEYK